MSTLTETMFKLGPGRSRLIPEPMLDWVAQYLCERAEHSQYKNVEAPHSAFQVFDAPLCKYFNVHLLEV